MTRFYKPGTVFQPPISLHLYGILQEHLKHTKNTQKSNLIANNGFVYLELFQGEFPEPEQFKGQNIVFEK